uniref:Maestro/Maestro-like HEAT-repeats domain-containing protein n=1 Tax=Hucho hucho TaxID=62062 RepID=A0A4W5Q5H7_9TELE
MGQRELQFYNIYLMQFCREKCAVSQLISYPFCHGLLVVEERLSPQVLSALEEDSQLSRLLACRSLSTLLKLIGPGLHPDALNNIYPEVLKRLDDSSEEVRGVALRALGLWLASLGKDYNSQLYSQHLEVLFQQLLLHLDDPDSRVQDTVLEVLKTGSGIHPALLKQEVEAVRDKQRTPVYCDQLLHDTMIRASRDTT